MAMPALPLSNNEEARSSVGQDHIAEQTFAWSNHSISHVYNSFFLKDPGSLLEPPQDMPSRLRN